MGQGPAFVPAQDPVAEVAAVGVDDFGNGQRVVSGGHGINVQFVEGGDVGQKLQQPRPELDVVPAPGGRRARARPVGRHERFFLEAEQANISHRVVVGIGRVQLPFAHRRVHRGVDHGLVKIHHQNESTGGRESRGGIVFNLGGLVKTNFKPGVVVGHGDGGPVLIAITGIILIVLDRPATEST